MTITCRVLRTVAFIISSAFLCAPKAHAVDRVVSTCDEAHFLAALKGGLSFFDSVSVTFSCAGIITLTHAVSIVIPTSIDGGGMVTLTGLEAGLYSDCKSGSVTCYGALDLSNITMQGFTGYALQNQSSNAFHVSNTTFVNNRANPASGLGGAIASGGPLYVHNCYFFLNSAFSGGAIVNYFDGSLVVGESTFFLNNIGTNGLGGAIYSEGVSMYIYNSTFTDNGSFTGAAAGNIYFDGSNGTGLSVINNSTLSGGRSSPGRAGNLFVGTTSQESLPLIVTNTIMANPATPYNCEGPMINGGGNLQWPASSAPCVGAVADPKLGLLANNGGTTMTMALMPGSAAIDKGLDPQCAATDQRHVLRPQGAHCDIGAYEAIPNVTGAVAVLVSVVNQQFRSSLPKTGQNRLTQQVLAPLSSSLDPTLWQADGNHLNPQRGEQVFDLHQTVVNNLSELIVDQTQLDYIDNLLFADRTLAAAAMSAANCGVPGAVAPTKGNCAQAAAQLAAGDSSSAAGNYGDAIAHYKSAWSDVTPSSHQ